MRQLGATSKCNALEVQFAPSVDVPGREALTRKRSFSRSANVCLRPIADIGDRCENNGMSRLLTAMAFLALAVGTTSYAQVRSEDECSRRRPSLTSPLEMVSCTFDLDGSQRLLEAALAQSRKAVPSEQRPLVTEAHRLWIAFRNAECARQAGGYPGNTMNSSDVVACTATMNRNRASQLRRELQVKR